MAFFKKTGNQLDRDKVEKDASFTIGRNITLFILYIKQYKHFSRKQKFRVFNMTKFFYILVSIPRTQKD